MKQKKSGISQHRRRSSFSLRGKRKSSIGELQAALHGEIQPDQFHQHISPELPDPVRLRQILVYAFQRMLDEMSTETEVDHATKHVMHRLFQDLITKKVNTSWYHREVGSSLFTEIRDDFFFLVER